MRFRC